MFSISCVAQLILLVLPIGGIPIQVDVVEINHVVDPATGCVRFEQVVWWDWCDFCGCYEVRDWRVLEKTGWPVFTESGWLCRWSEDSNRLTVIGRVRRETWTVYDVEIEDRKNVPSERRRRVGAVK